MQHTPTQLTEQLRQNIDALPRQMQVAAKYIIDHPGDFGLDPVRVTAQKTGISSNVLVRLAYRLGFDSFEAFRKPFRQTLVTDREDRLGQDWLSRMRSGDDFSATQAGLAQNELNVVTRSLRLADPALIQQITDHMISAKRCFITATRASYALAYYFHYAGRMAHPGFQLIPRHMGSAVDDLLEADTADCLFAITVHPYSSDTIQSMRFARKRGMRIVLLSDSEIIAPGVDPDVVLPVSIRTQHHFSSFSGAMAVLECLLGHLFVAGGSAARDRVDRYQTAREDTGAYWRPAKPPRVRKR
ncbi:iron dicitrate transport regulator FecR [Ruegeria sp. ANG-R]|uniref:MurR/RpiR family transcriptional regulator n=1 Tax=Ruegeria sp. ANG-R TaxID=1577903 RepID=UPI000580ACDA|nr:MurR/RpiR family transcriptional regulator [Ruegeria sp. ANG-R]KIC42576.1 iron dicitrate transport regulator FecR [Ruegeria sp. ANG-R]